MDYENRIFNTKDTPYFEIKKIIDEITIATLELAIEELTKEIRKLKYIDWN